MRALVARATGLAERQETRIVAILLALGGLWRILWVLAGDRLAPLRSEVGNVAVTWANTGRLADAYGHGVGLTAHVSPVMPIFQGLVYRAFGPGPAMEMTLTLAAIAFALVSFYFVYRCFKVLETPPIWRLAGLAIVCLAPLNAMLEVRVMRVFEGLMATALASWALYLILALAKKGQPRLRELAPLAIVLAVLALVHQSAALGVYFAAALMILLRVNWKRWPVVALLFTTALAVVLVPWGLRNQEALGKFIVTRSNFGIELNQAYYAGAVHPDDPVLEFKRRHDEMHPMASPDAVREVRQFGEVAYSDKMTKEAMAWIRSDPTGATTIAVRAFRQFWFPDPYLWNAFDTKVRLSYWLKSIAVWLITVPAFIGLYLGLRRNWQMWTYVALALILPSLPYIATAPVIRYRYIISTLLIFLAVEAIRRAFEAFVKPAAEPAASSA
jgi:hypothetical protein